MSGMIFTSMGLIEKTWDGDLRKDVTSVPSDERILRCLRNACSIEDGVTLLEIFQSVDKYPSLKGFIADYSWCGALEEFHVQATWPDPKSEHSSGIEYLEVYRHASADKFQGKVSFGVDVGFRGIGVPTCEDDKIGVGLDGKLRYSVSYCPLWEIAHLPVKLNHECVIYTPWEKGKSPNELLRATGGYLSLLEVLDAIYDDISFVGSPGEKADFIEDIRETTEGIKSGEIKTVPLDDILDELREESADQ